MGPAHYLRALYCLKPRRHDHQGVLCEVGCDLAAHTVPLAAATKSSGKMENARSNSLGANTLGAFVISNFWIGLRLNRSIYDHQIEVFPDSSSYRTEFFLDIRATSYGAHIHLRKWDCLESDVSSKHCSMSGAEGTPVGCGAEKKEDVDPWRTLSGFDVWKNDGT